VETAPKEGEAQEEIAGVVEEETPKLEETPVEEVTVEYVVGRLTCPKCGVKLELIHREPKGHSVREVKDV
jgi:uncharacterized protein (UPF0212 family)